MTIEFRQAPNIGLEDSGAVNLLAATNILTGKLNESARNLSFVKERLAQWKQDDHMAVHDLCITLRQYRDSKYTGTYTMDMVARTLPKEVITTLLAAMVADFHREAKKHLADLRRNLTEVAKFLDDEPLSEPPVRKIRPVDLSLESTGQTREPVLSEDIPF